MHIHVDGHPHLQGIQLNSEFKIPQTSIIISGTHIHEKWIASLYKIGSSLYANICNGKSITIITQSAVFSAVLCAFLREMIDRFKVNEDQTLHYYDLGQVLDIASPSALRIKQQQGIWGKIMNEDKLFAIRSS